MEHRIRLNILSSAVALAAAVVISVTASAALASRAYVKRGELAASGPQDITVKGYARRRVASDLAEWSIQVSGRGGSLTDAYAQLDAGVTRVAEFLRDAGFEDGSVSRAAIETKTRYARDENGRNTEDIVGYTLTQRVFVSTLEVERVAATAGGVTDLLKEGIGVISQPPKYYYGGLNDLKIQLAGDASANGRERADAIATEAGARVHKVTNARMGVIQITRPNSTEVSSYGIYDTSTIEKDVSVVVTLTLALEPAG
ncbi:MAG: SIMPL domain-containing protein [Planctomycetota bacterium]